MATMAAERAGYVGARIHRVEDPKFLMGRATYVDDVTLPGMLHAAFVRSPFAHARIAGMDLERARAHPGVVAVVSGADVGGVGPFETTVASRPAEVKVARRHLMPLDKARHVGEAVAAVVATSRYVAEDACELVEIDWDPLPVVIDPEAALEPGAPLLHEELGDNCYARIVFENGDVEQAFAQADHVFRKRFHFGRVHAAPLETRGNLASFDPATGELVLWGSNQFPHFLRTLLAGLLGMPENKLRVIAPAVGGGFGLKAHLFVEDVLLPVLSRQLCRPVKWIEDRYESLAASGHGKDVVFDLEMAVEADGTFLAFRGRFLGDAGSYQAHPWTGLIDPLCAAQMLPGLYRPRAVRYEVLSAFTNKCHSTAYRGVGWTPGHTAREVMIDDAARALGMDPLELRLKNCIPDAPYVSLTGCEYDGGTYAACQRTAAEMVDYRALRERQSRLRAEGRFLGIGLSPFIEMGAWAGQMTKAQGFGEGSLLDAMSVTVEPDGTVTVTTGLHSHGQSHETTMAQVVADRLGVKLESVRVVQGDTAQTAYATGTYGSRSAVVGGGAAIRAAGDVREKLVRIAAHALEVSPDDVELSEGVASVKGVPGRSLTVGEIAGAAYFGSYPPDMEPSLAATRSYAPPQTWSNATIVAVVEVDIETGVVSLEQLAVAEDCGRIINPMVVDGQIHGALAQAVGASLYEALPYDEDGQFLAGSLMDYLYPSTMEIPPIAIEHLETPSPVTEGGFKGMGEGGTVGGPAAIVNAVADALSPFGVSIDETPVTPDLVLRLLREARTA